MPLQADQSIGSRLLEKVGFQHIVGKEERNVHARATGRSDAVAIETLGAVDYRVQALRLALVDGLDRRHATELLEVLEHQSGQIPGECRWRVEHRSEEHTSELQSLMRIPYAAFCWK